MDCNKTALFKYEIVHINIRGATANKNNLENYLSEHNWPEIITLNETKLGSTTRFDLGGYKCVSRREAAQTGGSRGSMILVRDDIDDIVEIGDAKKHFLNDELIGIEIRETSERPAIKIFTYYNPPKNYVNVNIINYIDAQKGVCVLTGDLNCKNTSWDSSKSDCYGEALQDAIDKSQLYVCNDGSPTRCDPFSGKEEVLDLIIHSFDAFAFFQAFKVGDDVGSDHFPIHATYQFKAKAATTKVKERRIENTNWEQFKSELTSSTSNFSVGTNICKEEIDEAVEAISNHITSSFNAACPLQDKKPKRKYKFTEEIRELVKEKRKLRREKSSAAAIEDWQTVRLKMTEMNKCGNEIKKRQKQQRAWDLEKHCQSLNNEKDSRKFFQTFKKLADPIINDMPAPVDSVTITDEFGEKAASSQEKSDLFAKRLQRVHEESDYKEFDENHKTEVDSYLTDNEKTFKVESQRHYAEPEEGDSSELLKDITVDEIKDTLKLCKNKSSPGTDTVNYQILKKLPDAFLLIIAALFTCCFKTGYFPDKWKCAKTIMIAKPGKDKKMVQSYRPISLLSCLSKLLERIIAKRLSSYMEQNKLFAETQSGFRAGKMTSEHILSLTERSFLAFKNNRQ